MLIKLRLSYYRLRKDEKRIFRDINSITAEYNKIIALVQHRPILFDYYYNSKRCLVFLIKKLLKYQYRSAPIEFIQYCFGNFLTYLKNIETEYELDDFDASKLHLLRDKYLRELNLYPNEEYFYEPKQAKILLPHLESDNKEDKCIKCYKNIDGLLSPLSKEKKARDYLNIPTKLASYNKKVFHVLFLFAFFMFLYSLMVFPVFYLMRNAPQPNFIIYLPYYVYFTFAFTIGALVIE